MKKWILTALCLALLLCGCAKEKAADETTASAAVTKPAATETAAETTVPETEAPAEETTEATEEINELLEKAKTCIDKPVEDLYALIGEPESSDYASSCLGDGEDGNLYYDGFIVYTYREGDSEIIQYVE